MYSLKLIKKSMHLCIVYIFTENLTVFLLYIVGMIGVCAVYNILYTKLNSETN